MPKSASRSFKQLRPRAVPPKRITDDERREKYKREVLGGPGPVDCWLCAASAVACEPVDGPLSDGEVRCTVKMAHELPPEEEGPFVDPDTYMLHLSIALLDSDVTTDIVLQTYRGSSDSLDAPDWTRRRPGRELVFRQTKTELAELLRRVAARRADANRLAKRLETLQM